MPPGALRYATSESLFNSTHQFIVRHGRCWRDSIRLHSAIDLSLLLYADTKVCVEWKRVPNCLYDADSLAQRKRRKFRNGLFDIHLDQPCIGSIPRKLQSLPGNESRASRGSPLNAARRPEPQHGSGRLFPSLRPARYFAYDKASRA